MIRLSLIIFLLIISVAIAFTNRGWLVISALPAGLILNMIVWKSVVKSVRAMLPITVFIAVLASLQWLYQGFRPAVLAKTLAVFWFTASAFRLISWNHLSDHMYPGSQLSMFILYMMFIRHFFLILTGESKRVLSARSRAVFKSWGGWSFRSLAAALVSLFVRSMNRAERFYAAQMLKGFE
jgi:energy-coupling factor transporter transmembrane protein EcfT